VEEEQPDEERSGWKRPELGSMARHYGGDVYARRRLIAIGAAILVILLLFLLIAGC
jgi:hypothetical protein